MEQNSKNGKTKFAAAKASSDGTFSAGVFVSLMVFLASLATAVYYLLTRRSNPRPQREPEPGIPLPKITESAKTQVVHTAEQKSLPPISESSLLWISLAAVLTIAGTIFLRTQTIVGVILIVAGMALFGFTARHASAPSNWLTAEPWERQPIRLNWSFWGKLGLGASIVLATLSFRLFGEDVSALYPWRLHLLSVALLIWSSYLISSPGRQDAENYDKWNVWEIVAFVGILVVATFLRLYRFDEIPFGVWFDEAENAISALRILNDGYLPQFDITLPAHFIYLMALSFKIFGVSSLAMRAACVVLGVVNVAISFFLGREIFDRRLGLIFAFFLATSRWHINWSRIGMHAISVPLFTILSMWLLLRALRRQRLLDYTLAGISLGLGLCFYTPLYFFPIVAAVFLLFVLIRRPRMFLSSWVGFLFLALSFLIVSVPISQFALTNPETFSGRVSTTSIFTNKTSEQAWADVSKNVREHLLMFNYFGDGNGRHNLAGEPMLDPVSGAFLLMGVAFCLWQIYQPGSFLLIVWLLVMLLPGVFSLDFESPQSLRAIGTMPAAYLLAAFPIHTAWREWDRLSAKRPSAFFLAPLFLALGATAYINYHIFFDVQANTLSTWDVFSTPETIVGRELAKLGTDADVYVSVFYYNSPTLRFLAPDVPAEKYYSLPTYASLPFPSDAEKPMVFFVDRDRRSFFLQAKKFYPNAEFKEYKSPDGVSVLYQITLSPSDIENSQGVEVSYYQGEDWSGKPFMVAEEKTISTDWRNGTPSPLPFAVKWQGVLYADLYGMYHLTLYSPPASGSELYIDGARIPFTEDGEGIKTAEVELAKGSHSLLLKALGQEGIFKLEWQPPDGHRTPIPASNLFLPPISANGLFGKYFANGDWQSPPAFLEIDPWVGFTYHTSPLESPFTVEWTGRIHVTEGGLYLFAVDSINDASLFVNGVEVSGEGGQGGYFEKQIELEPGFYPIRLRYANRNGFTYVNLFWAPPDSERVIIPQEALFFP